MIEPEYIDIHSHISFPDFDGDREAVIGRMKERNIWAIDVGVDFENSRKASENSAANQNIFASAGLHPSDTASEIFDKAAYRKLFANHKVVAVGECGLDYFRLHENNQASQKLKVESGKERQEEIFKKHIELAIELNKPLIIHCRLAHDDVLDILNSYRSPMLRGDIHFFSGNWKQAQKYFDFGFLISFTGVITFTRDYDEIIKQSPLEKIMIETDAPFVAPVPYRGKRNEPLYVVEVAKKIAEIKNISCEEVAKTTTENAIRLFNLR